MSDHDDEINISRARIDSIQTYEVMEEELQIIERASPSDVFLNLGIASFAFALPTVSTLFIQKFENAAVQNGFIVASLVSVILGFVFVILWFVLGVDRKAIYRKIRNRKSPQAIREQVQGNDAQQSLKASADASPNLQIPVPSHLLQKVRKK